VFLREGWREIENNGEHEGKSMIDQTDPQTPKPVQVIKNGICCKIKIMILSVSKKYVDADVPIGVPKNPGTRIENAVKPQI
jgi:hypothetical protein